MGTVPEARLNLVIYHMHQGEVQEAYELMREIEPTSPQEYILKGITNLALGQQLDSREHLKVAQQRFQLPLTLTRARARARARARTRTITRSMTRTQARRLSSPPPSPPPRAPPSLGYFCMTLRWA